MRFLSAVVALVLAPQVALAGGFPSFRPLSVDELFAKRMRFHRGEPMISVGIMEAQKRVTLVGSGPLRLMFDERRVPKTVYAPEGKQFTFVIEGGRPAKIRYWLVTETAPYLDVKGAEALREKWSKYTAKVFDVGTVVGVSGIVLDTREKKIAIGALGTKKEADALAAKLFEEKRARTVLFEELVEKPRGTIVVKQGSKVLHRAAGYVYVGTLDDELVTVLDVEHGRGYASHGRADRKFWGHVYVVVDRDGKLAVVNSVGAEELLGGLVPAEIFAKAPPEALKAQAVTARGEIFSKLGHRHFGEPYHLCSEQHCQVYAGAGFEQETTNAAVAETRGLLAVRPRKTASAPLHLVDSVYASTCGGFSEANEIVWDQPSSESLRPKIDGPAADPSLKPFLDGLDESNVARWVKSYPPTYCARSTFVKPKKVRWTRSFSGAELDAPLTSVRVGRVKDVTILGRGKGGRVTGLRFEGTNGRADVLRELPVRRLFKNLNSGMFVLDVEKDAGGFVRGLTFTGGGWGHGVGMCQMGAIGRAEAGHDFRQILGHYYSGAVVERIY